MTLDQRFAYLAADHVVCAQDLAELKQMAAEMNTRCEEQAGQLDTAHAILVDLVGYKAHTVDYVADLAERARKWLEEA